MAEPRNYLRLAATVLLLSLGIGLMAYAFFWPAGDGGRSQWTAEHASAKRDAATAAHQLSLSPDLATSPEKQRELVEAHQTYKELEDARLQAIAAAARWVRILRWAGIVCVALGLGIYLQGRNRRE